MEGRRREGRGLAREWTLRSLSRRWEIASL
jgi:hypothetical protein